MLPLLAALPSIFSAVSMVSDIFSSGKEAVKKVTGNDSIASTTAELQEEIQSLPEAQQAQWAQIMQQKVDLYQAENQRLDIEIGRIDSNITSKLSPDAADKIAYLRQATRPWTVKMMVHYILFPFYLIIIDLAQDIIKNWLLFWTDAIKPVKTFDYMFGALNPNSLKGMDPVALEKILTAFTGKDTQLTLAGDLYVDSIPWVVGIIVSYMGLREIGKARGTSGDIPVTAGLSPEKTGSPITTVINTGVDLASKVQKIFGK
jgi:hypothetical protein